MSTLIRDKYGNRLSFHTAQTKISARFNTIILEFVVYLLHIVGSIPSHHLRRVAYRLAGMKIGKGSSLHMGIRFYNPKNITIGEDSIIGENSVLDGRSKLVIGDHVDIASEVMIYNSEHDIQNALFTSITADVIIEDYVFVGPRVIILPGVKIGRGAIVAAGAVVTKNVQPFSIVAGVAAREIGNRDEKNIGYVLGRAHWFR